MTPLNVAKTVSITKTVSRVVASILIPMIIGLGGCAPKSIVKHSEFPLRTKAINHWMIKWEGDIGQTPAISHPPGSLNKRFKNTVERYCTNYVDQVRSRLARKLGFSVAENVLSPGEIRIRLFVTPPRPDQPPSEMPRPDTLAERKYKPNLPTGESPKARMDVIDAAFLAGGLLFDSDKEHVRSVEISIFDADKKLLGEVSISSDKVKPKFVADVINRVIREGSWEKIKEK